jgi:hypothetical protein
MSKPEREVLEHEGFIATFESALKIYDTCRKRPNDGSSDEQIATQAAVDAGLIEAGKETPLAHKIIAYHVALQGGNQGYRSILEEAYTIYSK